MKCKCITLNIWSGGSLFEEAAEFLRQEDSDIVLLQEVYNGTDPQQDPRYRTVSRLHQEFPQYQLNFAAAYYDDQPHIAAEQGNAVMSKWPISDGVGLFFDIPYGTYQDLGPGPDYSRYPASCQQVTIMVDHQPLHVLNVHGIWGLDGGDSPRRLKMSEIILEAVGDKDRVIVGGDFNLKPNTQTIAIIEERLTNVFKDELQSSFNMKRKNNPGYATAVVDMLFVSADIKIGHHHCPAVDVSDHLPLIAELEIS